MPRQLPIQFAVDLDKITTHASLEEVVAGIAKGAREYIFAAIAAKWEPPVPARSSVSNPEAAGDGGVQGTQPTAGAHA